MQDLLRTAEKQLELVWGRVSEAEKHCDDQAVEIQYLKKSIWALQGREKRYDELKQQSDVHTKEEIRSIMRILISCGCKQGWVGEVVQSVAAVFGINLDRALSRRTVGRILLESLVMGRMQMGFELQQNQDVTMSSDSTSRRKLNYQAHHLHMKAALGTDGEGNIVFSDKPVKWFAGVFSTTDHSTATSHAAWMNLYNETMSTYNASPLGKRTGALNLRLMCRRLRGMCGDHANNEKALSEEMKKTKYEELLSKMGEKRLRELDGQIEEIEGLMRQWTEKKIADAGGQRKWDKLTASDRATRDLATTTAMIQSLGVQELAEVDDSERHLLTVWVWTGCCMHKDQNSFKGGNTAMTAHWKILGIDGPIPLANKENAKAIRKILHPERGDAEVTAEDLKKLEDVAFGGAKLTALAGAIFNNAIDKRGQGDAHQLFLEYHLELDRVKRFPQTNNTRFGSHGDAAVELLTHLETYRQCGRISKKNVYDGLHDPPTLTELAVLAVYHILITVPYMRIVRQDSHVALNAIDLGPLHRDIRDHCQLLIENPDLILDFDEQLYPLATFDGREPANLTVLSQIKALSEMGTLPYLEAMLVTFLEGAMATWIRFSSEFAPGGIIDGLSEDEKARIWLPATNDHNEGALGSYVVWARNNATGALHTFNGLAMAQRNNVDAFAQNFLTKEDHHYILAAARQLDQDGLERRRRAMQKEYNAAMVVEKQQTQAKKVAREDEITAQLNSTPFIKSVQDIYRPEMTRARLDDQLEKMRRRWNTDKKNPRMFMPKVSHIPLHIDKQEALAAAFPLHEALLREDEEAGGLFGVPLRALSESDTDMDEDFWDQEDQEMEEPDGLV
ncbi:hypothetical protein MIND_00581200 [Mycena indigotica]|uniref:Uncharacterized protein n=1 Tax=Mycena indigotica TaxID=2126181 RepID=A0A8H6ST75_9AGAR|nr:uncharacterized protein MIND_00581200 [Mycena indigotica]KAF7303520.1 hypothetical protein MIND_00581200 [Mycena indigotica]